jgi:biotin operon repressor
VTDQLALHFPTPTPCQKETVMAALSRHRGKHAGIGVAALADLVRLSERQVRKAVSELREEGFAICATPETGYYVAATADEIEECCQFLRSRAMHSLHLESRLRNIPLPDLLGQLRLKT